LHSAATPAKHRLTPAVVVVKVTVAVAVAVVGVGVGVVSLLSL
jgi:hypothetical protein